ncbi:cob(I)yrinic acid a,c-diamide adenosyltransferase [Lachnoclostridium sp. Marseille-P6806]|uniref:cob(I)yrinic acid a,c-diamide adenosyltransferase n=1 Tax=Lachnoclostridium sp. Marseille-P6806 TaxID=2364793 RepID=UPI0013EF0704|nr:cob(I)yrinic acid a,c-diamide adenosyltransferase [Lachnoclostridium sp. Marseille-P6806]
MATGRVSIYTGSGHGKTPAALGIALQRAVRGENVMVIQFLKGEGLDQSPFLERLEPELRIFRFEKSRLPFDQRSDQEKQEDAAAIRNGICFARKILNTAECDLLVLDEILAVVDNEIATVQELGELVEKRGGTDIVMTGITRNEEIFRLADEVTRVVTERGAGEAQYGGRYVSI